jgi:centrosomal protein CEP290
VRNLSDISSSQANYLKLAEQNQAKEIELLRSALKDLQMESDGQLIIGQLHNHILTLQKSESTSLVNNAELKKRCLRLEKVIIQLESENSSQNQIIFDLRVKSRNRMLALQKSLSDFRLRFTGTVLFEKHERACKAAHKLSIINVDYEKKIQDLTKKVISLETKLDASEAKSANYDELLETIENSSAQSQKRIGAWHKKMTESQNMQLKYQREAQREREKFNILKESADSNGKKVEELEDLVMKLQIDHDEERMNWESQQLSYENTISYFEEERDRLYLTTNPNEVKELLPDRSLPIGEQLEIALRYLVARSREAKVAQLKLYSFESKSAESLRTAQEATHLLEVTKLELNKIRLQLETQKEKGDEIHNESSILTDKSRVREANALRFAHETTLSLQRQLTQKSDLLDKYREMLQSVRAEMATRSAEKDAFIAELNSKIQELTSREIHRVQTEPETPPASMDREMDVELGLIQELRQLLAAKEVALNNLQKENEEFIHNVAEEKQALNAKIKNHQEEIRTHETDTADLKTQIAQLQEELNSANEILARPAVKDLSDVVSRLQGDLENRDQKIKSLRSTLQTLKSQLFAISKELAESKMNENLGMPNAEEILLQQKLATRISQLETRNKRYFQLIIISRTLEIVEKLKKELADVEQDMQRVSDELVLKNTEVSKLVAQNTSLKSILEKTTTASGNNLENLVKSFNLDTKDVIKRSSSWESDKIFQKKVETLKEKLKAKSNELESLTNAHALLKENIARSEKDRLRLQGKIQKLVVDLPPSGSPSYIEQINSLQNKVIELQTALAKSARKSKIPGESNIVTLTLKTDTDGIEPLDIKDLEGKSNQELLSVIVQLMKEIGKRESIPVSKYNALLNQTKKLKNNLQEAMDNEKNSREGIAQVHRLDEENQKLRKMVRKDSDKSKNQASKIDELSIANESLLKEIVSLRKLVSGVAPEQQFEDQSALVADLRVAIEEKEKIIQELMSPDSSEANRLTSENRRFKRELEMWQLRVTKLNSEQQKPQGLTARALQDENDKLKLKLKMLNEEVDDLRYNYKEVLKKSIIAAQ